ncbi:SDR family NAD(P)-dependent oxidoreductase [Actinacidiphila paucisporea]|uniref:Short-chain dehydrogenase n=1 Tax=Actinacidiphila paucisporea TaxID=310782 RepID=A0A1M7LSE2_9ACTN|nr:SDR family oxidoreductase [Actinacidiphila paucisporea]SHM80641.1 Short-chain dehydrogenase [Actinacidiphila paucisporea]
MTTRQRPFAAESLAGLSAVVTGGSRGLGLLIAGELAARGCTVTLAARGAGELDRAAAGLRAAGTGAGEVRTAVCDVRERDQVDALFTSVAEACGSVDVVVANAGIIQVAPVAAIGAEEFDDAMGTIFGGAVHTALSALPHLRRSAAGGRLALIGSVGGLLGVPHLLPYSCAKSAVAALAEGLHAEEAANGVTVTAVHPGLMRTGSHLHAEFGGDSGREFAWFSALAGTPLVSMDAERAAARIVGAVQRRRARIVLTPAAKAADVLHGIAPGTVTRLSGLAARVQPDASGARGELKEGSAVRTSEAGLAGRLRKWGSALNDRASARFNQ